MSVYDKTVKEDYNYGFAKTKMVFVKTRMMLVNVLTENNATFV